MNPVYMLNPGLIAFADILDQNKTAQNVTELALFIARYGSKLLTASNYLPNSSDI